MWHQLLSKQRLQLLPARQRHLRLCCRQVACSLLSHMQGMPSGITPSNHRLRRTPVVRRPDRLLRALEGRTTDFHAYARDTPKGKATECLIYCASARRVQLPGQPGCSGMGLCACSTHVSRLTFSRLLSCTLHAASAGCSLPACCESCPGSLAAWPARRRASFHRKDSDSAVQWCRHGPCAVHRGVRQPVPAPHDARAGLHGSAGVPASRGSTPWGRGARATVPG